MMFNVFKSCKACFCAAQSVSVLNSVFQYCRVCFIAIQCAYLLYSVFQCYTRGFCTLSPLLASVPDFSPLFPHVSLHGTEDGPGLAGETISEEKHTLKNCGAESKSYVY